jgi:hypothetical protein
MHEFVVAYSNKQWVALLGCLAVLASVTARLHRIPIRIYWAVKEASTVWRPAFALCAVLNC